MSDQTKWSLLTAEARERHLKRLEVLLQYSSLSNCPQDGFLDRNIRTEIAKFIVQQSPTFASQQNLCTMSSSTADKGYDSNQFPVEIPTTETDPDLLESIVPNGDSEFLEMLLNKEISVNPLHIAVENNKADFVEWLLNRGVNVDVRNEKNMTPLHVATIKGHFDIAKKLLDKGAAVGSSTFGPRTNSTYSFRGSSIYSAVVNADVAMTKLLLSRGAVVRNPELLAVAVASGNLDIIDSIILKRDIDVNAKCDLGKTALHIAAMGGLSEDTNCDIAKLLIGRGACVRSRTRNGMTPLLLAAQGGYAKLFETLLGFDPADLPENSEDNSANFSILRGSDFGLKDKAAQLCAKNEFGETALHLASSRNHKTVVEILLKLGIDINAKTIFGRTALDLALENGCRQTFIVLLKYGSDINVVNAAYTAKQKRTSCFCGCCCISRFPEFHRGELIMSSLRPLCAQSIRKQIVRLKTAGRFVSAENLRFLDDENEMLSSFRRECEEEIGRMRNEIIGRNVSLYDVLQTSVDRLAVYARNERVVRALEKEDFEKRFPVYSDMIRYNFKSGQLRDSLINISLNSFSSTIEYSLPQEIVVADIFRYLGNEDLVNLFEACQSSGSEIPIL